MYLVSLWFCHNISSYFTEQEHNNNICNYPFYKVYGNKKESLQTKTEQNKEKRLALISFFFGLLCKASYDAVLFLLFNTYFSLSPCVTIDLIIIALLKLFMLIVVGLKHTRLVTYAQIGL